MLIVKYGSSEPVDENCLEVIWISTGMMFINGSVQKKWVVLACSEFITLNNGVLLSIENLNIAWLVLSHTEL